MAQASRLNLRMQKEFKLLLTDPPPGASFRSLVDGSSASSLTSIEALLQGPEGSVYANGLFKIKIQIPERYPFQPPVVTFATPIYHPNIDTGGRICLDILNLPPKGSWQPSLNISTILMSIRLLLSEPNPDDGLMHDVSREYKYNRQAFDQNARSMTEKYARAQEIEGTEDRHGSHSQSGSSREHCDMQGPNTSIRVTEDLACRERSSGSSMKMSPEILGSCSNNLEATTNICSVNGTGIQQLKEANNISDRHAGNTGKLLATRSKLSLKTSVVSHGRNGEHSDVQGLNTSMHVTEDLACHERSSGSSMKMSPKIQESCRNTLEAPINICSINDNGIQQLKGANNISGKHAENPVKLLAPRSKLSLKTSVVSHVRNGKHESSDMANQCSSGLENRTIATHSRTMLPLLDGGGNNIGKGSRTSTGSSTILKLKKKGLAGLTSTGAGVSSRLQLLKNKENIHPLQCLPPQQSNPPSAYKSPGKQVMTEDLKQSQTSTELLKKQRGQVLDDKNANAIVSYDNASSCHPKSLPAENNIRSDDEQRLDHGFNKYSDKLKECTEDTSKAEATIVLDSEDSEDERAPVRPKLSLRKRHLTRKRKSCH